MSAPFLPANRSSSYTCLPMTNFAAVFPIVRAACVVVLALILVSALLLPTDASAQRKKVVFGAEEEGSVVEGTIHKPEVSYIISREEQEDLETLQLKQSFTPKIVRSVDKAPF